MVNPPILVKQINKLSHFLYVCTFQPDCEFITTLIVRRIKYVILMYYYIGIDMFYYIARCIIFFLFLTDGLLWLRWHRQLNN